MLGSRLLKAILQPKAVLEIKDSLRFDLPLPVPGADT